MSTDDTPEALGIIELGSLIRGYRVVDAMVKRAPVNVRDAYPVSSGKFLIFVDGMVAEVEEAMDAGLQAASGRLVGKLLLSYAHADVWRALDDAFDDAPIDAIGLLLTTSVAEAVLGADTALKAAEVRLAALRLAKGIGGRAYFVVVGTQPDVEAAIEAAEGRVALDAVLERDVITAPHDDMTRRLLGRDTIHPKY